MSPALLQDLRGATAPDRVLASDLERVAFASDASMYHLVPRAVVLAKDDAEVAAILAVARRYAVPVTFRAAGTSLSGQAVTDGILVEVARHWRSATVEDGGRRLRSRPGMLGAHLNALLAPHQTRLGPDPSSLAACTLGGILANNSSGPCSGVEQNSYHTLESLTFVLPSGVRIDTADRDADEQLRQRAPELHRGLLALRTELLGSPTLRARVERKYRTKNTTGYGLNALLDYERPIDILAHALIGSEGTLAFISEAVLRTVPLLAHTSSAFLLFPSVHGACEAIVPFREAETQMVELLDEASLRAIAHLPGVPRGLADLPRGSAALLVQAQGADAEALGDRERAAIEATGRLSLLAPGGFTRDARQQERLIHARKGLYPAVGGRRVDGTTLLLEDVAFPVERLAAAAVDLQELFRRHGYDDAVIFGHAKDGNLHFLLTQPVADAAQVDRYARFLDDLVDLVVHRHDGALKAEHGTGRNMAAFVETEWGGEAVAMMRRLKVLCDPDGVLSPGVIFPASPRAHLEHLKSVPAVGVEVDRCVECGYCEPVCPSRALTLTPRQRIVVLRERARRVAAGDRAGVASLDAEWTYPGLDTCAADGLCATACPVEIDTGALVTRLRGEGRSPFARGAATLGAEHYGALVGLGRAATRIGHAVGMDLPAAGRRAPAARRAPGAIAVYFPSCMGRVFAGSTDPVLALAERAGVALRVPDGLGEACCGLSFDSKGLAEAGRVVRSRTEARLTEVSEGGRLPVVVDGSSCALAFHEKSSLHVLDSVAFARAHLLPRLTIRRRIPDAVLHVTCGAIHLGLTDDLKAIANAVADRVSVLATNGCCGFAGDRGFTHPELTASATAPMANEIRSAGYPLGLTSNLPCGIGMARATGIPFRHILEVLEEVTR
ncbi:MAG: FAD-binding and (Fe-S)-binding domain-containing protein [Gemmatimonadales bacterium]